MQSKFNQNWIDSPAPALSVMMLGFRRADLLASAIASFHEHNSVTSWELVLVLNGASPEVKELAEALLQSADFPLLLIEASGRRPGAARNLGVERARGSLFLFLDDDIECFQDIGKAACELFKNPTLMAAGGANLTPPGSGGMERAAGYVLGSRLGAASMSARYRNSMEGESNEHALILCNLAVRREAFFAQGGFATHLISNEENVLLQQLEREGHQLWHSPRLAVFHRRRDNWRGTLEQAAKYGSGRAQNLLLLPHTIRPVYFLPAIFFLYLFFLPLLRFPGSELPLYLYGALVGLWTAGFALKYRDRAVWLCLPLFPGIHLAYGLGFMRAMLVWGMRRKKLLEHALDS